MQKHWVRVDSIKPWFDCGEVELTVRQMAEAIANLSYNPIRVQRISSRIVSGVMCWHAARLLAMPAIPVVYVDLDNDTAKDVAVSDLLASTE